MFVYLLKNGIKLIHKLCLLYFYYGIIKKLQTSDLSFLIIIFHFLVPYIYHFSTKSSRAKQRDIFSSNHIFVFFMRTKANVVSCYYAK